MGGECPPATAAGLCMLCLALPPLGPATSCLYMDRRAALADDLRTAAARPALVAAAGWLQDAADRCTASSSSSPPCLAALLPSPPAPAALPAPSPGREAILLPRGLAAAKPRPLGSRAREARPLVAPAATLPLRLTGGLRLAALFFRLVEGEAAPEPAVRLGRLLAGRLL